MVSGFLISPYDQDRIFSGLAIEILIWSNTCAGTCGLKRFMISWFIVFSLAVSNGPISFRCHARERGASSHHRGGGLLDRPPARAMTTGGSGTHAAPKISLG